MKIKWSIIYSTCLGCGFFPKIPGTIGTLLSFAVYLILPDRYFINFQSNLVFIFLILLISVISIPVITKAEKYLGHDSGKIIIDEFLGYMVAVSFLPKGYITGMLAFIFFRIFDIWKLEPANSLQKLPGGSGVMADDIMAGIYANILTRLILKFIL